MYKFNISAPATVFLHGDFMENYDKTSIAAGLNIRTKLTFSSLPPNAVKVDFIELNFSRIKLHIKIPLTTYLQHFNQIESAEFIEEIQVFRKIQTFVNSLVIDCDTYDYNNLEHFLSLQAFFFLLVLIAHRDSIKITASFVVKISSELPIGNGLGSSASFAVCLAACFWRWSLLQKGKCIYEFDERDRLKIGYYSDICDDFIFNSSTRINVNVSVNGSISIYNNGCLTKTYDDFPSIKILLVSSNVKQESVQNRQFDIMRDSCSIINPILDNINVLSNIAVDYLQSIGGRVIPQDLILLNQGLLNALGASHPYVDIICAIAQNYSLRGKMTYRGRCGYVFIVLPPNFMDNDLFRLINELESYNFSATVTNLCGKWNGMRVESY
ncbi:mevalonate kinase-like [Pogonomyrmex barbatus]|uniref:mevalonate kinase n=1 Tax=Pogonomyrmex barbatus TaxID=144034 RepID=A0A6I9WCI9_9HYME|nr:mevalonate kinase-like [Pogonomyrmex barbatus]